MRSADRSREERALDIYVRIAVVLPMVVIAVFEIGSLVRGEWVASAIFVPFLGLSLYRLLLIKSLGYRVSFLGSAVDLIAGGQLLRHPPER